VSADGACGGPRQQLEVDLSDEEEVMPVGDEVAAAAAGSRGW
jgi:hypothetical protein